MRLTHSLSLRRRRTGPRSPRRLAPAERGPTAAHVCGTRERRRSASSGSLVPSVWARVGSHEPAPATFDRTSHGTPPRAHIVSAQRPREGFVVLLVRHALMGRGGGAALCPLPLGVRRRGVATRDAAHTLGAPSTAPRWRACAPPRVPCSFPKRCIGSPAYFRGDHCLSVIFEDIGG